MKVDQPCPSSWWGYPVCGPCHCDVEKGYNADCNKTTGECYCKVSGTPALFCFYEDCRLHIENIMFP